MELRFTIHNQRLRCLSSDICVEGSRDYLTATFETSEAWRDHVITVFFQHNDDDTAIARILPETLTCEVPAQVIKSGVLHIWARGDKDTQTIPTNKVTFTIYSTGPLQPETDVDGTPDVYNQILMIMQESVEASNAAIQRADEAIEIARRAEELAQNGSGGTSFTTDETLLLDKDGVLRVNTAHVVEANNTLPVTSAAVHVVVGNINALLETI